jgi:hypothetical protein
MTADEEILAELAALKLQMNELQVCLTGDKLKGRMGIIDILETHRRELYGDEATKDVGLKDRQHTNQTRIESLEGDRVKVLAVSGAVSLVVMVGWALIKTFFIR